MENKTLQDFKDEVAKEQGYCDYTDVITYFEIAQESISNEAAERYASHVAEQACKKQDLGKKIEYKIMHGNSGWVSGDDDKYSYDTALEATESIKQFKANPQRKNHIMSDENAYYWKSQTYHIIKVETSTISTL